MAIKSHEKARAERAKKTLGKIEKLAVETIKQVRRKDNPAVDTHSSALQRVASDKHPNRARRRTHRTSSSTSDGKKFMQTFLLGRRLPGLLESKTTSIHTIFSRGQTPSGSQGKIVRRLVESDPISKRSRVSHDALREESPNIAAKRGMVDPWSSSTRR
jgi:hypothetical protein